MNEIILLNKKELLIDKKIANNQTYNLYLIDLFDSDVNLKVNLELLNECSVNIIISSLNKENHKKNYSIFINHVGNNSFSKCETYCVANNESFTKIDMLAKIDKESAGNNCEQKIRGILISDLAKIEGQPNLIIDTNNVKAKHALAVGKLNPNHLFYFQSKGISKKQAIQLLLFSYFNVVISNIENEQDKEKLISKVNQELNNIKI